MTVFLRAHQAYLAALGKWASLFLSDGKFVAGEAVSIADYKVVSFCFPACESSMTQLVGFEAPPRIKQYVSDFMAAVKSSSIFTSAGGFAMREVLATKAASGASRLPPHPS